MLQHYLLNLVTQVKFLKQMVVQYLGVLVVKLSLNQRELQMTHLKFKEVKLDLLYHQQAQQNFIIHLTLNYLVNLQSYQQLL